MEKDPRQPRRSGALHRAGAARGSWALGPRLGPRRLPSASLRWRRRLSGGILLVSSLPASPKALLINEEKRLPFVC